MSCVFLEFVWWSTLCCVIVRDSCVMFIFGWFVSLRMFLVSLRGVNLEVCIDSLDLVAALLILCFLRFLCGCIYRGNLCFRFSLHVCSNVSCIIYCLVVSIFQAICYEWLAVT